MLKVQEVRGKKKRGGSRVGKGTVLVDIVCESGYVLPVLALVDGIVLEVNQRLTPALLARPEGYIAVINPVRKFRADEVFEEVLLAHQE